VSKRASIQPTYDSRATGPRYTVTTRVGDRTIEFERRLLDPFVNHRVTIGWPDLLRALLRRRLVVTVIVGGDRDVVDDVLELDAEWLGGDSTRRDEFTAGLFKQVAVDEELAEMLDGDGDDD
jgi:hypothetical protein